MQLIIVGFAVIGLGTTGVFTYQWLLGGDDDAAARLTGPSQNSSDFVTGLEFTPDRLRVAVEGHGVRCDGGWQDDGNGADVCAGDHGYYAIVAEPIDRLLDGYVSGQMLVDDPDHYMIATADAALVVPMDDMGWLYKVWDDCSDCYGWMTNGGREEATEFSAEGLIQTADNTVNCSWNHHGSTDNYSSCIYADEGYNLAFIVFDQPDPGMLDTFHSSSVITMAGGDAAAQFYSSQASRFITVPMMRACQASGPCRVQTGDGDVWEFDPKTPEDVEVFFKERAVALG